MHHHICSKIDLMPDAGFSFDLGDLGQNLFGGTASIDPAEIRVPELSGAAKDLIDGLTTATEPLQDTSLTKIIPKLEDAAADLPKIEEVVPSESSDISDIFDKAKESMETYDIFDSSF